MGNHSPSSRKQKSEAPKGKKVTSTRHDVIPTNSGSTSTPNKSMEFPETKTTLVIGPVKVKDENEDITFESKLDKEDKRRKPGRIRILNIPPELFESIFFYLKPKDKSNIKMTCVAMWSRIHSNAPSLGSFWIESLIQTSSSIINGSSNYTFPILHIKYGTNIPFFQECALYDYSSSEESSSYEFVLEDYDYEKEKEKKLSRQKPIVEKEPINDKIDRNYFSFGLYIETLFPDKKSGM
jgi:hypothetical protein